MGIPVCCPSHTLFLRLTGLCRSYKPSESDMDEDDDDEEEDEEEEEGRPAWWDEDDQEDGIKGQDIIEPDTEELSSIIRIDEARIPFSIPRDE